MAEHVDLGQATARQARDGAVVALEGFTPMGNLMRRYWLPAVLSSELVGPDSGLIRLRILGEDLVAFRDSKGRVGILEALCPHRRAPLYFGRNEESGLTCIYHGWKFSVDGACLAMPNVPSQSDFRQRIRNISYPVREAFGIVWAFMGPKGQLPANYHPWIGSAYLRIIVSLPSSY